MQDYHQEGVTVGRGCDSPLEVLEVVRKVCKPIQRCDSYRRGVKEVVKV